MSIDFVAIDFETANKERASPCSVGMTKVVNGKIVENYYSLINPECPFDSYNTWIHGIDEEMVQNSPTYPTIIAEIIDFLDGLPLVAHYAPFDMGVIAASNERYNITNFQATYFDSYFLSKQHLTSLNYKLDTLAKFFNFEFQHHNALEDSKACANLVLYLCDLKEFTTLDDLIESSFYKKLGVIINEKRIGFLKSNPWKTHGGKMDIDAISATVDTENIDPDHPFYQKKACFTGKLQRFTRREAMSLYISYGGIPENSVTVKTNYLIMGDLDFNVVGESGKSAKIKRAEKLLSQNQEIQLVTENEFLRMLDL